MITDLDLNSIKDSFCRDFLEHYNSKVQGLHEIYERKLIGFTDEPEPSDLIRRQLKIQLPEEELDGLSGKEIENLATAQANVAVRIQNHDLLNRLWATNNAPAVSMSSDKSSDVDGKYVSGGPSLLIKAKRVLLENREDYSDADVLIYTPEFLTSLLSEEPMSSVYYKTFKKLLNSPRNERTAFGFRWFCVDYDSYNRTRAVAFNNKKVTFRSTYPNNNLSYSTDLDDYVFNTHWFYQIETQDDSQIVRLLQ